MITHCTFSTYKDTVKYNTTKMHTYKDENYSRKPTTTM